MYCTTSAAHRLTVITGPLAPLVSYSAVTLIKY